MIRPNTPCRLHAAMELQTFFGEVYARRPSIAGGSQWTVEKYREQLRVLQNYWRQTAATPLRLCDLTDELIEAAMAWHVSQGCAVTTANALRRHVLAVWRYAHRKGLVDRLPRVDSYRECKREPQCWSIEEMGRILAAAGDLAGQVGDVPAALWWRALILFIYNTGVRITAVMNCRSEDLDLAAGWVLIRAEAQKQKADQRFALLPSCSAALAAIAPERHARVFDDWPYDRQQRQWEALNRKMRKILACAGLPHDERAVFHKLRRTAATFVAGRLGKAAAMTFLGHSALSVTERYLDKRYLDDAAGQVLPDPEAARRGLRIFTEGEG